VAPFQEADLLPEPPKRPRVDLGQMKLMTLVIGSREQMKDPSEEGARWPNPDFLDILRFHFQFLANSLRQHQILTDNF
jgi:hypothetical protein